MESADLVVKVKELLASKKQIHTRLTNGKDCYCVMGVVALALGYQVQGNAIKDRDGVLQFHVISIDLFPFNSFVDSKLLLKHKDSLGLTAPQVASAIYSDSPISWEYMNDVMNFSFQQFSTLIDLVMENRDVVEI